MSTSPQSIPSQEVAGILQSLDQPSRLEILQVIGNGEACVCHLEAALGQRQAYISQHLMALRDAGLITSRRSGRFVFYRLKDRRVLDLVRLAGSLAGVSLAVPPAPAVVPECTCPHCVGKGEISPELE